MGDPLGFLLELPLRKATRLHSPVLALTVRSSQSGWLHATDPLRVFGPGEGIENDLTNSLRLAERTVQVGCFRVPSEVENGCTRPSSFRFSPEHLRVIETSGCLGTRL